MSDELTREQLETALKRYRAAVIQTARYCESDSMRYPRLPAYEATEQHDLDVILATFAAQRAVIARLEAQMFALQATVAALAQELADRDTVPRSRYDACNKDWLEALDKLKRVQDNATAEIAKLEQERDGQQMRIDALRRTLADTIQRAEAADAKVREWENREAVAAMDRNDLRAEVETLRSVNVALRKYLTKVLVERDELQARVGRLEEALKDHWVTAVECNHEANTDTVRCACSMWTGTPQPSVGKAIEQWVEHVMAQAADALKGEP